ncbi:MAG: secondary thiamine-phosphate synthase enzyme YjbQ [Candidatus Thorarchaeota archaeon]
MRIVHTILEITTEFENQLIKLDNSINQMLTESKMISGIINIFCPGSTGAISTIEYEEGLIKDFPVIIDKIVPPDGVNHIYFHNKYNSDDNGHSHLRATIIGPSLSIPFENKKLMLGIWQNIIFIEFDRHTPRQRKIVISIMGE